MAIVKPGKELATLTEWSLNETFPVIRRSAEANRAAWYVADLIGRFLHQPDPHPVTWDATLSALRGLQAGDPVANTILSFQWRVLCDMGYRPRLDLDGLDGDTLAFSSESGGIVADTGGGDRWRVRRGTIQLLVDLDQSDGEVPDATDPSTVERASRLLATWTRDLLGVESVPMRLLFGS